MNPLGLPKTACVHLSLLATEDLGLIVVEIPRRRARSRLGQGRRREVRALLCDELTWLS